MQKHVNLVDLVKSFPTNIFLQNLASIQRRTSPLKFAHLAEKSEKGSVSNLPTKARADRAPDPGGPAEEVRWWAAMVRGTIAAARAAPRDEVRGELPPGTALLDRIDFKIVKIG